MENETKKQTYESPQTEVVMLSIEQSIANTSSTQSIDDLTLDNLLDEI